MRRSNRRVPSTTTATSDQVPSVKIARLRHCTRPLSITTTNKAMAFCSPPTKTSPGRLSYLPSDVEEDLGIIDFDDPQYDFLGRFYLCEDISADDDNQAYERAAEWLNSVFESTDHDPYFDVQLVAATPVNGLGRFDYLSRSGGVGGRFNTATITRRRNETMDIDAPKAPLTSQNGTRFGTITKRCAPLNDSCSSGAESDKGNRTYVLCGENGGTVDNSTFTVSPCVEGAPQPPSAPARSATILTDPSDLGTVSSPNTNTITKNRRSYTVRSASQQLNIFNNNNNNHQQQAEDEFSVQSVATTESSGSRNYPTISRNEARSILHPQRYANSNDDLASDSSSVISAVSNLSMTSSVSQPSLLHSLSVAQHNNNNNTNGARKSMSTRPGLLNTTMNGSRLYRPSSQNGIPSRQTTYTKLPNSSFGSMGNGIASLQQPSSNMSRNSSQTAICEDSGSGCNSSSGSTSQLLSQLNSPALSRNSTFRVHRPSPIPSVATVFAASASGGGSTGGQPVAPSTTAVANGGSHSSLNSILHTSQEEIDQFRAKVNSSNGNLRSIHTYQQGAPPQQANFGYQNRSDSPSSNSSSCSSNSSTSRLRFAPNGNGSMTLANRLNNNHHHYQPGSTDSGNSSSSSSFDVKAIGSKGYNLSSHNLNHNSSQFASNNNNSGFATSGGEHNGLSISTNSKSAHSRIPAMPKAIATNASNRSAIPVSGTIPRINSETLAKKTRLASAFPVASKLGPPQAHRLIANKLVDDNSWQNDCF